MGWEVGDLALCVRTPTSPEGFASPIKMGEIHTVAALHISNFSGALGLELVGVTFPHGGQNASRASNFRKITPGAKIEGIEEPRRVPVPKRTKQDA